MAALAANAGKRMPSAPLFPATLRPGKRIVTTTHKVRYWNTASICWKRARPLPRESKGADRKSTRLNSSHVVTSRMPSSAVTATKCAVTSRLGQVTCVVEFALLVRVIPW